MQVNKFQNFKLFYDFFNTNTDLLVEGRNEYISTAKELYAECGHEIAAIIEDTKQKMKTTNNPAEQEKLSKRKEVAIEIKYHEYKQRFEEWSKEGSHEESLMKASAVYEVVYTSALEKKSGGYQLPWRICCRELCFLKAQKVNRYEGLPIVMSDSLLSSCVFFERKSNRR
jgi:hypothetical protein